MTARVLISVLAIALAGCDEPTPPSTWPWAIFYGAAAEAGDLERLGQTFRLLVVEADPALGYWTDDQLAALQREGRNRVLTYLNVGSCEHWRSYWSEAPAGFVPCGANRAAQLGAYAGYPDEEWMDPANGDYQRLLVDLVAAQMAARPIDGFFLDNMELIEHGTDTTNGPCDAACVEGGLRVVRALRQRFPSLLIVINHGTSDAVRLASIDGDRFAELIDGVHEEGVYHPVYQPTLEAQLLAWRDLRLRPGGRPFWIGTTAYVGGCDQVELAREISSRSRAHGFAPYVSDAATGLNVVCYWPG